MTYLVTWSNIIGEVSEKSVLQSSVPEKLWSLLFDLTDTVFKCKAGHFWAVKTDEPNWARLFYSKALCLLDGVSFRQLKTVASMAHERSDVESLNICLEQMISIAESGKIKNHWTVIMALLSKDDPRWQNAKDSRAII